MTTCIHGDGVHRELSPDSAVHSSLSAYVFSLAAHNVTKTELKDWILDLDSSFILSDLIDGSVALATLANSQLSCLDYYLETNSK